MLGHRSVVTNLLAIVIASASAAAAQSSDSKTAQASDRTILFSASGGISKGAYQGGVDWTLSEFVRRQRTQQFRRKIELDDRRFVLGSATGASAGNINAVFAALAWCTDRLKDEGLLEDVKGIAAEQSLFWKAWVNTGVSELLPDSDDNPEPAALDRRFFETVHRQSLNEFRARAVGVPDCQIPVGVTLTRVVPIEVSLEDGPNANGSASVQRFASIFSVVSKGTDLDFAPSTDHQRDSRSLGALAILPALYDASADWTTRANAVFNVILASSSFPIAFAPRPVSYLPGGLKPKIDTPGPTSTHFADGGVFDNNPLGLAIGLFELGLDRDSTAPRMLAYSSPESYRGGLAQTRRGNDDLYAKTGLGAAVQLATGALRSARQYELQLFARQIARDAQLTSDAKGDFAVVPKLRLSSRALPIVGETLASFGAFLGRPFRERDFYLGIYDGLEFVARNILCEGLTNMDLKVCVARQHIRLVTADVFDLSPLARAALAWFAKEEYGIEPGATASLGFNKVAEDHYTLLEATNRFLPRPREQPSAETCARKGDPIARAVCPGGLDLLLARLQHDTAVRRATAALLPLCTSDVQALGECIVDRRFSDLLAHPGREVYRIAKKAIENIELAEDQADEKRGLSAWVETGFSVFRAATYRYRPGPVEFMMSSAREWDSHGKVATLVGYLAPGYLQWTHIPHHDDAVAFGWRPFTFVVNEKLFVGTHGEVSLRDFEFSDVTAKRPWGWGWSIGSFAIKGTAAVEVGMFKLPQPVADQLVPGSQWGAGGAGRWIARASVRTFADKIQITVLGKPEVFTVGVGLNDLNGILFWLAR